MIPRNPPDMVARLDAGRLSSAGTPRLSALAITVLALTYAQTVVAEVSPSTVMKFNTLCGRCHEGECSGRLSFSSGIAATQGHIRRHLPSSTPPEVEELYSVLKYTKEHCAHYPLMDAVPANGIWSAELLRQWRAPDGTGYFVPLGRMGPGTYRLTLRLDGEGAVEVRITNEKLEVLLEEQQCKDQVFVWSLPVAAESLHYLHLKSGSTLQGLALEAPAR